MINKLAIFLAGLIVGLVAMLAYHRLAGRNLPSVSLAGASSTAAPAGASPAGSPSDVNDSAVVGLGSIEPKGGIVNLASPLVGHRIQKISAQEGNPVNQNDVLVQLDSSMDQVDLQLIELQLTAARERREAEIARAKQALGVAQTAREQLREGRELELGVQDAKLAVLAAKTRQTETDLNRLKQLRQLADPLVSDQQVEQQSVLLEVSRAEQQAGDVGVRKLKQSLDFQLQTAEADLQGAEIALRLAEADTAIKILEQQKQLAGLKLKEAEIRAPFTGTILSVQAHENEVVTQSPLLRMANLEDLVCTVEVDATDIPHLQTGQKALVASRAFRGPFPQTTVNGTIDHFGSVVAKAAVQPLDPRKPVDRHVVQVVVAVDAAEVLECIFGSDAHDATALVGLQVEVRFPDTNSRAKAP